MKNKIIYEIAKAQQAQQERNNPSRQNRVFHVKERVLEKTNRKILLGRLKALLTTLDTNNNNGGRATTAANDEG